MRLIYRLTQWALVACFKVYFRLGIRGKERVPLEGPVLLASTHASYLDPMLVGAPIARPSCYLARRTLFRPKWWGAVLRAYGAIPLEREGIGVSALRTVLELLKSDNCVVIFPEGTRSEDGRLRPLKGGVGMLARRSGARVVPVAIVGNENAWRRGSSIPRPVRITMRYGEPMEIGPDEGEEQFLERLRDRLEILRDEALASTGANGRSRSAAA
ncbi:MAG: 1-acyl-sn-glycerol-3-phosphate acyltransferase [Planctomycetes bacterium]|nr:1-acyl-sn-glycerol-3-phosphate acyltransferase [Planctomycetota bacterium]